MKTEKSAADEKSEQNLTADEEIEQPEFEVSDCTNLGHSFKEETENEEPD